MAKCEAKIKYRCSDDCVMEGCPSHDGTLVFNSVVNSYHFKLGNNEIYLLHTEMQAMVDLLKRLDYRSDLVKLK